MALRVAEPGRIRTVAIVLVVGGLAAFEASSARGPVAWAAFVLLAGGIGGLDALHERRLGWRQGAVVLVFLGTGLAVWSGLVAFLLRVFFLPVPAYVWAALAISLPVGAAGAWLVVRRIREGTARAPVVPAGGHPGAGVAAGSAAVLGRVAVWRGGLASPGERSGSWGPSGWASAAPGSRS
ncbi:MAG: hypothetical protein ACRDI0_04930 [Actinomycetota bacterium]